MKKVVNLFSLKSIFLVFFGSLLVLLSISALEAAEKAVDLPVLVDIGIVPIQWTGELSHAVGGADKIKSVIEKKFYSAVRDTKRFQVMNDDLVAEWWKVQQGRKELVKQFELSAFMGLNVVVKPDVVTFVCRLMGSKLENYLVETDSIDRRWLETAETKDIEEKVEHLVFAMINRLPVDVYVTSVQGTFVTLSGGIDQGLKNGDEFPVMKSSIIAYHAANNAWLSFKVRRVGTIRIMDARENTAIAKLLSLTYDNSVQAGAGIKVDAMPGRVKFARMAEKDVELKSPEDENIVIPPFYPDKPMANKPTKQVLLPDVPKQKEIADKKPEGTPAKEKSSDLPQKTAENDQPPFDDTEGGGSDDLDFLTGKVISDVTLYGGLNTWNFSGPTSGNNNFPIWLLNKVGLKAKRPLVLNIHTDFGGGIGFGTTKKGSYLAYEGMLRIFYEDKLDSFGPIITHWRGGLGGIAQGLAVNNERFGGGDWIRGGAFAGVSGNFLIVDGGQRIDWSSEFALMPLTFGQVGYSGKKKLVKSSMGMSWNAFFFLHQPKNVISWGGGIAYDTNDMLLDNKKEATFRTFDLLAAAKYEL